MNLTERERRAIKNAEQLGRHTRRWRRACLHETLKDHGQLEPYVSVFAPDMVCSLTDQIEIMFIEAQRNRGNPDAFEFFQKQYNGYWTE